MIVFMNQDDIFNHNFLPFLQMQHVSFNPFIIDVDSNFQANPFQGGGNDVIPSPNSVEGLGGLK